MMWYLLVEIKQAKAFDCIHLWGNNKMALIHPKVVKFDHFSNRPGNFHK